MAVNIQGNQIVSTASKPSIDADYGPYTGSTLQEALNSAESALKYKKSEGKTIGIKVGTNSIIEYWYKFNNNNELSLTEKTPDLSSKQDIITNSNKLDADLVDDANSDNKFVTSSEKTIWNGKQNPLTPEQLSNITKGGTALQPSSTSGLLKNDGTVDTETQSKAANAIQMPTGASSDKVLGYDNGAVAWVEKPSNGQDGAQGPKGNDGADAVNPFKGYYPTGVSLPDTGAVGDYLYAPPSDPQSTATATIWHYDANQTPPWTDTGIDVSAVVGVEFGRGQSVPATKIKDENGSDVIGDADVLSAEAGMALNTQINGGVEITETDGTDSWSEINGRSEGIVGGGVSWNKNFTKKSNILDLGQFKENGYSKISIKANDSKDCLYTLVNSDFPSEGPEEGGTTITSMLSAAMNDSAYITVNAGNTSVISIEASDIRYIIFYKNFSGDSTSCLPSVVTLIKESHISGIVIDSLDSDDATKALSAKQGKILNEKTNELIVQEKGTSTASAMSQKAVTDILDGTSEEITQIYDYNSFDQSYIVNRTSHTIDTTVTAYKSTQRIEIPNNLVKIEVFGYVNNQYYCGVAFDKDAISSFNYEYPRVSELSANTNDGPVTITKEWIEENASDAKYFVATAHSNGANYSSCYVKIITLQTNKGLDERISDLEESVSSIGGYTESMVKESHSIIGKAASLTTSDVLSITIPNTFKHYQISFSMNLSSDFNGRIQLCSNHSMCHGRIEIDSTNVYFYDSSADNASPSRTIVHGLTIQNNISVCIIQHKIHWQAVAITIITDSGIFTDENILDYWYMAYNVPLTLKMVSGSCTNAELVFTMSEKTVWLFGDSYLDYIVRQVNGTLNDSIKNLLLDGFPGRNSQQALASLNKSLAIATPKILVWGMGMNDGDDNGAIDTNWKSVYDSVNEICQNAGIELVLVTIPTTPTVDNNHKNAFIKASGHRFIDIAAAVGADGTGNWTSGYLSSDNVHPTTAGARVVLGKYVVSLPEIFS